MLRPPHALDALTVYRDLRPYLYKLTGAIRVFHLDREDSNSNMVTGNIRALFSALRVMAAEQ